MPFSIIPFLLLVVPIVEIGLFIVIGGKIGIAWTLAMIVITAVIGSILLRMQGFETVNRIRKDVEGGGLPGKALFDGAMIVIAGILLLTPGFFTDAVGFLLFVPPVRAAMRKALASRITIVGMDGMKRGNPFGASDQAGKSGPFNSTRGDPSKDGAPIIDLDEGDYRSTDPANDITDEPSISSGDPNADSPWTPRKKK